MKTVTTNFDSSKVIGTAEIQRDEESNLTGNLEFNKEISFSELSMSLLTMKDEWSDKSLEKVMTASTWIKDDFQNNPFSRYSVSVDPINDTAEIVPNKNFI